MRNILEIWKDKMKEDFKFIHKTNNNLIGF